MASVGLGAYAVMYSLGWAKHHSLLEGSLSLEAKYNIPQRASIIFAKGFHAWLYTIPGLMFSVFAGSEIVNGIINKNTEQLTKGANLFMFSTGNVLYFGGHYLSRSNVGNPPPKPKKKSIKERLKEKIKEILPEPIPQPEPNFSYSKNL